MIAFLKASPEVGPEAIATASYPIPRDCPRCSRAGCRSSVIGHGRRDRASQGEHESEIRVRRGLCRACGGTITFLPPSLRPYRRYTVGVIATVVRQRLRGVSYSQLAIVLHNSDVFPDPATVRRWCRDFPRPPTIRAS